MMQNKSSGAGGRWWRHLGCGSLRAMIGLGFGLMTCPAMAKELGELYRVELPARDQSLAGRERLARQGLRELVQRLTGLAPSAQDGNPALGKALADTQALVQAFGFRAPSVEERDASGAQFVLQLDFEPVAVQKRLNQAGLPVWGRERPETLLWLVMPGAEEAPVVPAEPASTPSAPGAETVSAGAEAMTPEAPAGAVPSMPHPGFLNPGEAPALEHHLHLAAQRRGLPLVLPKDEPAEREALSLEALRMPVSESLEAASLTYGADTLAAAELLSGGGRWTGRAHLLVAGELESWDIQATGAESALDALLDGLGERLARRYALREDAKAGVLSLRIGNVQGLKDYAQLMRYLASLSLVKQASVREVRGHELTVELHTGADARALAQTLALGRHLVPVTGAQDGLNYQWQP